MTDDGPIQRLEPALEPLTKGLAPGAPVRKKAAEDCMAIREQELSLIACRVCGATRGEMCKL